VIKIENIVYSTFPLKSGGSKVLRRACTTDTKASTFIWLETLQTGQCESKILPHPTLIPVLIAVGQPRSFVHDIIHTAPALGIGIWDELRRYMKPLFRLAQIVAASSMAIEEVIFASYVAIA
jgi:hypothetical protein